MKKILFVAAIAGLSFACNNNDNGSGPKDPATPSAAAAPAGTDSSAKTAQSALKDGLMTLKDGKVEIVKNGAWAPLDSAVTCSNGRKVALDGTISKGDKKRKLEEGQMIDKDGQLTDKDGKPLDTSGWD